MSTLKTVNIQHPSASTPAITLDSAGAMTGSFPYPNRNLLYNGAMQVHQRGTSTAGITAGSYYTADRWAEGVGTQGTWTNTVENDAPTGSGFRKSLRMLCTTADASPAAGDEVFVQQQLEGQDLQRIAKGTAAANQLTLSFWVKANVTGTYVAMLYDLDNTRMTSKSYTISASATWEYKTITFSADTTGAFDNDNAASIIVRFYLGAGSSSTSGTLQTAWAADVAANRAVGQTNLAAATNNYWQITGVQLETGSIATPFEFKSYGQELAQCQRYYYKTPSSISYRANPSGSSFNMRQTGFFPVTMRIAPNISIIWSQIGNQNCTTSAFSISTNSVNFEAATPNATAWGNPHYDVQYEASAEL